MRKLFFLSTLIFFYTSNVKAQALIQEQFDFAGASIQEWTVPAGTSFLTINAVGAQGGNTQVDNKIYRGGGGAQVIGDFPILPGSKIIMIVGGIGNSNLQQAGGGGGTFVFIEDNNAPYTLPDGRHVKPLLVAGGGGGAYMKDANGVSPASDEEAGKSTKVVGSSILSGGSDGNGGQGADAGGGDGLLSHGTGSGNTGGNSLSNLFAGGTSTIPSLNGGFGGGGAGYPGTGSGGGGGWSGGAAGRSQRGGGGGSYNSSPIEDSKVNLPGGNAGNFGTGRVIVSYFIGVLPLKMGAYTGHLLPSGAMLRWSTTQEINTSHFEIEKSTDGHHFTKVGQVAAAGSSTTLKTYSFLDARVLSGVNHYRMKMVDNRGRFLYSKTVVIRSAAAGTDLQVFPNPATAAIQLQTGIKGTLNITIYDAKASPLKQLSLKSEGTATTYPIDVSQFKKGLYYIKVQGDTEVQTTTFIKK